MKLKRHHPNVPAGLCQIGDAAILEDGSRRAVIDIGHSKMGGSQCTVVFPGNIQKTIAIAGNVLFQPSLEELEQEDPHSEARLYAQSQNLLLVRSKGAYSDEATYCFASLVGGEVFVLEVERTMRRSGNLEFRGQRFACGPMDEQEETWLVALDGDPLDPPEDFDL